MLLQNQMSPTRITYKLERGQWQPFPFTELKPWDVVCFADNGEAVHDGDVFVWTVTSRPTETEAGDVWLVQTTNNQSQMPMHPALFEVRMRTYAVQVQEGTQILDKLGATLVRDKVWHLGDMEFTAVYAEYPSPKPWYCTSRLVPNVSGEGENPVLAVLEFNAKLDTLSKSIQRVQETLASFAVTRDKYASSDT